MAGKPLSTVLSRPAETLQGGLALKEATYHSTTLIQSQEHIWINALNSGRLTSPRFVMSADDANLDTLSDDQAPDSGKWFVRRRDRRSLAIRRI
jgi:hypothetical protein